MSAVEKGGHGERVQGSREIVILYIVGPPYLQVLHPGIPLIAIENIFKKFQKVPKSKT